MYFGDMRLVNLNTHRDTHTLRRLTEEDPILEICNYSTDVTKSTAGDGYLGGRSSLVRS